MVVGLVALAIVAVVVLMALRVVAVPLLLALFPAALLAPTARRLRDVGIPAALVAALLVTATVTVLTVLLAFVVPLVVAELPELVYSLAAAVQDVTAGLQGSTLALQLEGLDPLLARVETLVEPGVAAGGAAGSASDPLADGSAVEAATIAIEAVAGVLLGIVALFFYLKDGGRLARGLRDLLPERARSRADAVGAETWATLSGYIRGQLLVALLDAVLIGTGLALLGVPLALPLAVLVLLGGLLPIVGAVASGGVAVLVALADGGLTMGLLVLGLVVAVQQAEGHVLQPVIVGRATRLHPFVVIVAITAGGLLLGVLGAFVAVPAVACALRTADVLRRPLALP